MNIEQIYTGCLAQASYFIFDGEEAAVIDPIRDVQVYLDMAAQQGVNIKYIFETHFHADFVSGHLELHRATGATIVYGPTKDATYDVLVAEDGQSFSLGSYQIIAIHTPGHTPESTCYLAIAADGKEEAVFTGDTLFVGDVGRPDLLDGVIVSTGEQVNNLYYSLRNKVLTLPDHVVVYPGHGPGSMCGKSISNEKVSTIGKERQTNYALQDMDLATFTTKLTEGQPKAPAYFVKNAIINRKGYEPVSQVIESSTKTLSKEEVIAAIANGAWVLDTRDSLDFVNGHILGAINIQLGGPLATWVGTVIPFNIELVVTANTGTEEEVVTRLARIGYERVVGFTGDIAALHASALLASGINVQPEAVTELLDQVQLLDVRTPTEVEKGKVQGVIHIPLAQLASRLDELDKVKPIAVYCAAGYRSTVARSLLERLGFSQVKNILGGYSAIAKTSAPIEIPSLVA